MVNLHYVPFRELAVIGIHLQGEAKPEIVNKIAIFLRDLLRRNAGLKDAYREVGLLNVLINLLADFARHIKATGKDDIFPQREDTPPSVTKETDDNFSVVLDCIDQAISNASVNATLFQKCYTADFEDLLYLSASYPKILQLLTTLLVSESAPHPIMTTLLRTMQSVSVKDWQILCPILETIYSSVHHKSSLKDAFRVSGGHGAVFSVLMNLENITHVETEPNTPNRMGAIEIMKLIFRILSSTSKGNDTNRALVADVGGPKTLRHAVEKEFLISDPEVCGLFFGILFAYATDHERLDHLFVFDELSSPSEPKQVESRSDTPASPQPDRKILQRIDHHLRLPSMNISLPHVIIIILQLQQKVVNDNPLKTYIIYAILSLSRANRRNQVSLNQNGLLLVTLEHLLGDVTLLKNSASLTNSSTTTRPQMTEASLLTQLAKRLIAMGVNTSELTYLFRTYQAYRQSPTENAPALTHLMELLLYGMTHSRWPTFLQFELTTQNYSGLQFDGFPRAFPPNSGGYTFLSWFHIERQDPTTDVTLFDLYDSESRNLLSFSIDSKTQRLVIKTLEKYVAMFETFEFQTGYWYHLALVHHKSKMGLGSSTMSMFVNGAFIDQIRCAYVTASSSSSDIRATFGASPFNNTNDGPSLLAWDLGPTYIIDGLLDGDVITLIFNLGARYKALFQDSLRQFQTYETSTTLYMNLRSITKSLGKSGNSEQNAFVNAMRGRGSSAISEEKLISALFANNVITPRATMPVFHTGLSRSALDSLRMISSNGDGILNAAISMVETGLVDRSSIGKMLGNPVIAIGSSLDDTMWQVGGCSIALFVVQEAQTTVSLMSAVSLLFELIKYNWRNSEDMERLHGYQILALLLKQKKRSIISVEFLEMVLKFVGKDSARPEESIINNPFAYRYLLLDFDIWRRTDVEVQRRHLEQFASFIQHSRKRSFNNKRLLRMHLVKKMLFALRTNVYSTEVMPTFMSALRIILLSNWTTESIRAIATYLACILAKKNQQVDGMDSSSTTPTMKRPRGYRSFTNSSIHERIAAVNDKSQQDVVVDAKAHVMVACTKGERYALGVMEMLHDILCDRESIQIITRFTATITNKWPLLFFDDGSNLYACVLASRILSRMCYTQGQSYLNRIRATSEGFVAMRSLLTQYWYSTQLYSALLTLMLGIDVALVPLDAAFDLFHLMTFFRNTRDQQWVLPEILQVVLCMAKSAISYVVTESEARKLLQNKATGTGGDTVTAMNDQIGDKGSESQVENEERKFEQAKSGLDAISRMVQTLVHFMSDSYHHSGQFKEVCLKPETLETIIDIVFPVVCGADEVLVETELNAKDSVLSLYSNLSFENAQVIGDDTLYDEPESEINLATDDLLKRGASAQLMTKTSHYSPKVASPSMRANSEGRKDILTTESREKGKSGPVHQIRNGTVEALVEFLVFICVDALMDPMGKSTAVLESVFKGYPPSFQEHQVQFQSYLLNHIIASIQSEIQLKRHLLNDTRILNNVSKFTTLAVDNVFQGYFTIGAETLQEFILTLLLLIGVPENLESKHALDQALLQLQKNFNRLFMLQLSDVEQSGLTEANIVACLNRFINNQKLFLCPANNDLEFLRCLCYHLYHYLGRDGEESKRLALQAWKLIFLQKPNDMSAVLRSRSRTLDSKDLYQGFQHVLDPDFDYFLLWCDSRKSDLNIFFEETLARSWDLLIEQEQKVSRDANKTAMARRNARLKRLLKNREGDDNIMSEYGQKTDQWARSIAAMENTRFTRALQDKASHDNYIQSEWTKITDDLFRERALWGSEHAGKNVKWKLDPTEGRNRMRKKLQVDMGKSQVVYMPKDPAPQLHIETQADQPLSSVAKLSANQQNVDEDRSSMGDYRVSAEMPGTEFANTGDSSTQAANQGNDGNDDEDSVADELAFEEDKNRKVLRLLDPGDMVVDVYNVSQITALDVREGLLVLCKNNIYLIDNFFQRYDGEVVEVWDVPAEERDQYLQLLAANAGIETGPQVSQTGDKHECKRWPIDDVREVYKRKFLFRDVALEIFFNDGRNALITLGLRDRDQVYAKLLNNISGTVDAKESVSGMALEAENLPSSILNKAVTSINFGNIQNLFGISSLNELMQRWERREMTNFQYLMYLNTLAGRSFNDLTQYPVFPWILADFTSDTLDLNDAKTFRDLSKPMGAQTADRREQFAERYRQWAETDDPSPAFHYGTHYSSAMIVCSFLIRLEPFTQQYLKLQGGTFDHADRLFDSVGKAWESASEKNMGDVRELIPEFFYLPEFLENTNRFDFGVKQGTGETIDSVVLPPWAKGDPLAFIQKHREALESDYVSANLHHWIDLIFGYKQQGPAAIENVNVFHHLSYEGAVDLDAITDPVEKTATIGIIHNFGQTPRQLFRRPHAARQSAISDPRILGHFPFETSLGILVESILPVRDLRRQVGDITIINDRLGVTANQQHFVPGDGLRYIEWGFADNSMRLYSTETGKTFGVFENMHVEAISCACFADDRTLITGGTDGLLCMWRLSQGKMTEISLLACLRGHRGRITAVATSKSYSIIVSASEDQTAIVWDLNRKSYVRQLEGHETKIDLVAVNDTTGDIMTCSSNMLKIWTINGRLLVSKQVSLSQSITACHFYEPSSHIYMPEDLVFTGHPKGLVKIWRKTIGTANKSADSAFVLELVHELQHTDRLHQDIEHAAIVKLLASSTQRVLYTGDTLGRVHVYALPDGTGNHNLSKEDRVKDCMFCGKAFAVLGIPLDILSTFIVPFKTIPDRAYLSEQAPVVIPANQPTAATRVSYPPPKPEPLLVHITSTPILEEGSALDQKEKSNAWEHVTVDYTSNAQQDLQTEVDLCEASEAEVQSLHDDDLAVLTSDSIEPMSSAEVDEPMVLLEAKEDVPETVEEDPKEDEIESLDIAETREERMEAENQGLGGSLNDLDLSEASIEVAYPHPCGEVHVTGDFDNWSVSTPLKRKDNVYITKLHLPNGVHKIKFVVDGDWKVTDHYEIMREEGDIENNVIYV
ncbi:hypothetical protein BZG36_05064 [Bifiguratus adelaidae]|uniref:Beach-domain-containing protein n=1 Tax=Bifiguratus adelaidae TaxID=1938954 RepID=A0A261XV88_9FUNG|nr:hypothetical protein BZG36_05064 [Bifiguratus adelaidae]